MESHDNVIEFVGDKKISSINFQWNDKYVISNGEPWGGVNSGPNSGPNDLKVVISAGRHGTEECAAWYNNFVNSDYYKMIHTSSGDNIPKKLNFAIQGTLSINNISFEVCMGQGNHDGNKNWHIASGDIAADNDAKNGRIGNFELHQDGNHTFKVRLR